MRRDAKSLATEVMAGGTDFAEGALPSPTKPVGLGPPSPAVRERSFELNALQPLSRSAAEGGDPRILVRGEAGEGLFRGGADRGFSEDFGGVGDWGAFEEVEVLRVQEAHGVAKADQPCGGQ